MTKTAFRKTMTSILAVLMLTGMTLPVMAAEQAESGNVWDMRAVQGIGANMNQSEYSLPEGITVYSGETFGLGGDSDHPITKSTIRITLAENADPSPVRKLKNSDYRLIADSRADKDMTANRTRLQKIINAVSDAGGGEILIAAGMYYFNEDPHDIHIHPHGNELAHCLLVRDNVTLRGILKDGLVSTWFCPVGNPSRACDMFTEYEDLTSNADFRDIGIDAKYCINEDDYLCRAKGYMIAPMENCDWYNCIVLNTGGTGFGVDQPVNCSIINCTAVGCGKDCTSSEGDQSGASGFGIGYGLYSDHETIVLDRCLALNNRRYGVFFENQYRFNPPTSRYEVESLVAKNCISAGNLYNYGGEYSFGAEYINCASYFTSEEVVDGDAGGIDIPCRSAYHFGTDSGSNYINGIDFTKQIFADVPLNTFYAKSVNWAYWNGITTGKSATSFDPDGAITRGEFVTFLWRYRGRQAVDTTAMPFADVPQNAFFASPVMWAYQNGITTGTSGNRFSPYNACTRCEIVTFLWRAAGRPEPKLQQSPFKDVDQNAFYYKPVLWAYENGITTGTSSSTFSPEKACSRAEAITFLCRFAFR